VIRVLDRLKAVLILDGFDEIEYELRNNVISQIKEISLKTNTTKIIVTTRTGEFNYAISGFSHYEISPLSRIQIESFVDRWIDKEKGKQFLNSLDNSTFSDTAIKPLILSFLCTIYDFNGELPSKSKFIYREIIDLLISKWDRERGFGRKTKFKGFDKNQKLDFMTHLAFYLVMKSKFKFSKHDIKVAYSDLANKFDLPKFDFQEVVEEIEEHSGLFIQSGVNSYEFPHKSLQEFLASEYLVRYYPLEDFKSSVYNIPNELAIVVSLSTNPNKKLIEILDLLVVDEVDSKISEEEDNKINVSVEDITSFMNAFLGRLETEDPKFETDYNTAVGLSIIWDKKYMKNTKLYDLYLRFYNLKGVKKCYTELEKHFSCDPQIVIALMKDFDVPSGFQLIELTSRKKKKPIEKINVHFRFIENWKYIKPHLN